MARKPKPSDDDDEVEWDADDFPHEAEPFDGEGEDLAIRRQMFADPGGKSALRVASVKNPRNLPCPTCSQPDRLTPADRAAGYQCDSCADLEEGP